MGLGRGKPARVFTWKHAKEITKTWDHVANMNASSTLNLLAYLSNKVFAGILLMSNKILAKSCNSMTLNTVRLVVHERILTV